MKVYSGRRRGYGPHEVLVTSDEGVTQLEHRVHHSPTGFEWGYGGSGPADLARSIIWDVLGEKPTPSMYMAFKFEVVAKWGDQWSITEGEVRDWITRKDS